jgi:hypothetical protein
MIFPDAGHTAFITKYMRQMRRHNYVPKRYGTGSLQTRIDRILEDPHSMISHKSWFIQIADVNAYAALRSEYVEPIRKMDRHMWDELCTDMGDIRLKEINKVDGSWPPGIKKYPLNPESPT